MQCFMILAKELAITAIIDTEKDTLVFDST